MKQDDLENAIKYFNKSLAEHRTADILNKMKEAEKMKKEKEKAAYHNPELAEKEREAGNELFKNHDFVGAVGKYTEAIKRNENDPKSYSNRAAAYTKLMSYPEALKDCKKAIELDPTFVKAYIRIAAIEYLRKDYTACIEACEQAKSHDTDKKHTGEIDAQMMKAYGALHGTGSQDKEETMKQAMNNPEVQVKTKNSTSLAHHS
jgi:stress-induced-phosphoprotein 1